jgi:dual specificity MAP kinase phosphatase
MSLVDPAGLYIGNRRSSESLEWLAAQGIALVVNATDDLPNPHDAEPAVRYVRVALEDVPGADLRGALDHEDGALPAIAKALAAGESVLVHCRAGSSRSASLVLAYLVQAKGLSLWEAHHQVSQIHPIKPNAGFSAQLIAWEEAMRGSASVAIDGFGNWRRAAA